MKSPAAFHEESRRRERLEQRLSRAAFRLEMAELERTWAIVSANREGWSIREIAKRVALGPMRCVMSATTASRSPSWRRQ